MSKKLKSGQKVPYSGQYEIIGTRGGRTGEFGSIRLRLWATPDKF